MKVKFKNLTTGDIVHERELLPAQEKFWKSEKPFVLMSGGFGNGKTEIMLTRVIYECMSQPDNYFLLGRKTYTEIYDVLLKDFFDVCHPSWIKDYKKTPHPTVTLNTFFPNKTSTIIFRNTDKLASEEIKGLNLGGFAVDQAEQLSQETFQGLTFRLRRQNIKHRVFLTQNPELTWLYKVVKDKSSVDYDGKRWELVEAASTENYKNLPPATVELYESYKYKDPGYYKQYVLGIWDESLLSSNVVFAREHIEKLKKGVRKPIREVEGLMIYKDYVAGHRYQMGVDCSEGLDNKKSDWSAITIADLTTMEEVAHFAGKIPPDVLGERAVFYAGLFSKEYPKCLIVPEMNAQGVALVNKIRDLGWERIYQRTEEDRTTRKVTKALGWRTTSSSKVLLISHFRDLLRNADPIVYSHEIVQEFRHFIHTNEAKDKGMGAKEGYHDDRLISLLLAFWEEGEVKPGRVHKREDPNMVGDIETVPSLELINGKFRPPPFFREGETASWQTL